MGIKCEFNGCRPLLPLESYFSHCGRYRSTIDYILLLLCLESKIIESKTFELDFDNTSDHQPLFLEFEYPKEKLSNKQPTSSSAFKHKIGWSSLSQETIHNKYVIPLQSSISIFNVDEFCDFDSFADVVNKLLLPLLHLFFPVPLVRKKVNMGYMSAFLS